MSGEGGQRGSSMLDLGANTDEERKRMRSAMVQQEGLLESLFQLLRNIPRRCVATACGKCRSADSASVNLAPPAPRRCRMTSLACS